MQCPSCDFSNIPGSVACARCQTRLDLDGIDVLPPRAGDHIIPLRMRQTCWRLNSAIDQFSISRAVTSRVPELADLPRLLRGVIPGWTQRRDGRHALGWTLTIVWIVLVLGAIYLRGGARGWPAYFAVVGWHGMAISLILAPSLRSASLAHRAAVGIATWLLLNALLYVPAGTLMSRLIVPIQTDALIGGRGVRPGEVLLHQGPWLRPPSYRRGDVVVYVIHRRNLPGVYIQEGRLIDRVLGVPGDAISMTPTSVTVNGRTLSEADELPLRSIPLRTDTFVLDADEYLIVPSLGRFQLYGIDRTPPLPMELMRVHHEDILGRVVYRTRPFWRAGSIDWLEMTREEERAAREAASATPPSAETASPNAAGAESGGTR